MEVQIAFESYISVNKEKLSRMKAVQSCSDVYTLPIFTCLSLLKTSDKRKFL